VARDPRDLAERVRDAAHIFRGDAAHDYDPLLALARGTRLVLLGEASHGTHEFYRERARITKRLIVEQGFDAVAVEADWPDAHRVNCWVRGVPAGPGPQRDGSALDALEGFRRFPQWMWRNADVVEFVEWLRVHNAGRGEGGQAGFYGIDLYSLHASMDAVLRFLERTDPEAARRARFRYRCFDHHGEDPQSYGYAASYDLTRSCEEEAVRQLLEFQTLRYKSAPPAADSDSFFSAEQNARLVANAEEYYRTMFRSSTESWNLRDRHMVETIDNLLAFLSGRLRRPAKVVVWAHNSHLGDARATEMGDQGELNVGQLVRERYGDEALLVGFSTFSGWVTAADDWDEPAQRKRVRPALNGSYERLFHDTGLPRFLLTLRGRGDTDDRLVEELSEPRLERAIGVIYRPETERTSHYFNARLAEQFDAVLHFDETTAVEPLERTARWERGEVPEAYPTGI
jgi:erythromycin esterase-like protein